LVEESGCGKTTIGRLIVGPEKATSGSIILDGEDLTKLSTRDRRKRSDKVQLMFQDSYAPMDPRMRVGPILREPLAIQKRGSRSEQRAKISEILDEVGLPWAAVQRYPHEFSGGQHQRLGLARALILRPFGGAHFAACHFPLSEPAPTAQAEAASVPGAVGSDAQ